MIALSCHADNTLLKMTGERTRKHNQSETTYVMMIGESTRKQNQRETKEKDLDRSVVGFMGYRYRNDMIGRGV